MWDEHNDLKSNELLLEKDGKQAELWKYQTTTDEASVDTKTKGLGKEKSGISDKNNENSWKYRLGKIEWTNSE